MVRAEQMRGTLVSAVGGYNYAFEQLKDSRDIAPRTTRLLAVYKEACADALLRKECTTELLEDIQEYERVFHGSIDLQKLLDSTKGRYGQY